MQKPHLTLYHGTDARILSMSKEERTSFLADVDRAREYLWTLMAPICNKKVIKELRYPNGELMGTLPITYLQSIKQQFYNAGKIVLYKNLFEKMTMADLTEKGAPLYQYGSLYVTLSKQTAIDFARRSFAGGERGLIVYRLLEGAEFLGISLCNLDNRTSRAILRIKTFAEDNSPRPVIVILNDVDPEDLLSEGGDPVCGEILSDTNYRYIKDVDLSLYRVESILPPKQ